MKFIFYYGILITNVIFAYQYDNYQPELRSASLSPSDMADSYLPAGSISIPREYRQSPKNDDYGNRYQKQSPYNGNNNNNNGYIASIHGSQRNVRVIDIPSKYSMPAETMTIQVPPSSQPLTFILKSRSSEMNLQSSHQPDPGSYQETNSEDGLHVLVHTVTRPVLQEIREIITPYRRVTQEIKPVQETAETLVAQDSHSNNYNNNNPQYKNAQLNNKPKQQQQQPTSLAQKPLKPAPMKPQPQPQKKYSQIQQQQMKPMMPKLQPKKYPGQPLKAPVLASGQKPKTY